MRGVIFLILVFTGIDLTAQVHPVASAVYRFSDLEIKKEATRERRQVLQGSTRDLELLEIHTSTLEPGKSPHPSHTHETIEELVIVKEGKLKVTLNNKRKILGPGSVALALPGEEHGFENGGDTRVTYYIIKYKSKAPMDVARGKNAGGSFMLEWNEMEENKNERGSRIDFFERPTAMAGRYEMHVTRLKEGLNSHAPHTHRAEEIVLIIKGDVEMQIGERHEKASAGDLVFLGSEVLHALTNKGDGPCQYFAFQWQ